MKIKWKIPAALYWGVGMIKTMWELFNDEPIIRSLFMNDEVNSYSNFMNWLIVNWLFVIGTILLLVVFIPPLYKKLRGLNTIIGQEYKNKTIKLDGNAYINCTFENCTFRWNGDKYQIKEPIYKGSFRFETQNQTSLNTVYLLKHFGALNKKFAESWEALPKEHFD